MGPAEMVVAIVAITATAGVLRAKHGHRPGFSAWRNRRGDRLMRFGAHATDDADLATENRQLRDELHGLKERIQVLERLATDDESDARRLDREIEKLRERPQPARDRTGE